MGIKEETNSEGREKKKKKKKKREYIERVKKINYAVYEKNIK
jgi:hypothetical protein